MQISSLIKPEFVRLHLAAVRRVEAIRETADLLKAHPHMANYASFYDELLARERVESTCLGNEIAFPHARTDALKGMVLAIGRSDNGVLFENCGQNVRLLFVIGTPKRMVTDYLKVVGGLARILKSNSVREGLLQSATVEDFVARIHAAESQI